MVSYEAPRDTISVGVWLRRSSMGTPYSGALSMLMERRSTSWYSHGIGSPCSVEARNLLWHRLPGGEMFIP